MPGNENGDRLHNFFLQDNSSAVQHHQQFADGAWSSLNNNLWVGSTPQFGVSSANTKIYNLHHSDTDRGQSSHALHGPHGLNFTQNRSDFARHPSQNQQPNFNGSMFGSRANQTRQDEANISVVDTVPDHYNFVSRGLPMYGSHQGIVPQHQTKSPMRSGTSDSPATFDLFGNQQQMHHPQSSMLHSQRQQPGFSDMHPLQQQIIFRKMQELQRQQQVLQLDNRQQNAVNPVSSFAKQSSGAYPSSLVNSSPNSNSGNNLCGAGVGNMNWQQNASPVMQGSSNRPVFSSNDGQAHRLIDLVPQQGDQSLCGVPVSGSRGNVTQFSQMATKKPFLQQMGTYANSIPGNQYTAFAEQAGMQDDSLVSGQRFSGESSYERPGLTWQQENSMQRITSPREIHQEVSNSQSKVATSQSEVSLDPTEERILFGSDDNLCANYGKNPGLSGDGGGQFDSFQSGTWSALMQSAVAETSSSDIGQQDELCGMSSQNTSLNPTNQHPAYSGRQEMSFHSDMPSSVNTSAHSPDINGKKTDYQNVLGVQQLENKLGREHDQILQISSSKREPTNMSNLGLQQNAATELRPMHGNASPSLHTESNMKYISAPWTSTQSGMRQEYGKSNGWNTLGSVSPADGELTNHQCEKSSQHSQGYEQKRVMGGVHADFFWNSGAEPHCSVESERAKSVAGNLSTSKDGYYLSNSVGSPNLNITRSNETSQDLSSQGNYWKIFNPVAKPYDGESMEGSYHHINRENQTVDSSLNSWNKAEFISSQRDTHKQKGNSKDSYTSNFSGNNSAGGVKETWLSDVGDSPSLPSRNQNVVDQIGGWKTSVPPKFQFHPTGNLEEEVEPYGMKQSSSSHGTAQKRTNHGKVNTSRIPESSVEMKKGHLTDSNDSQDISNTLRNFQDHRHNVKNTYSSSQNMLELFDKVDQSRDHGQMMHSSPSGHNFSSEKHETDNSGRSISHLQCSQSFNSQGFGLQLGPPSHKTAVSSQHFLSQSNLQTIANSHQSQVAPEIGEKGQSQFPASPTGQSLLSVDERILGEFKRNRSGLAEQALNNAFMQKLQGNLSPASNSGITYSSQFQYLQPMARTSGQVATGQYDAYSIKKADLGGQPSIGQSAQNLFLNARNVQHDNPDALAVAAQQIGATNQHSYVPPLAAKEPCSVSLPMSLSSSTQQGTPLTMPPNMWSNVARQPQPFNTQIHKTTPNVPDSYEANVLESSSSAPRREAEQDAVTDCKSSSVSGGICMNRDSPAQNNFPTNLNSENDRSQGMEPASFNLTNGSPSRTAKTQKDIEAFGRSLVSNTLSHQHYSLLNQMQAMKSAESDTNDRALKKMKGLESSVEGQKVTPNASIRNAGLWPLASSGDSGVLSFSELADNTERKTSAQFGTVPSQSIIAPGQKDSEANLHGNSPSSSRVDHPNVSSQMAPSWFNHHGAFRNGQMLAIHDAMQGTIPKITERPFTLGRSSNDLQTSNAMEQVAGIDPGLHSSTVLTVAIQPQSLQLNIPRPKKRKRLAFCYISWPKEVPQKCQTLQTIRMAEEVWAKAVNRIPEKIVGEIDLSGNGSTTVRAKRRLSLTTHLMQQLLCPPISVILSSNAESDYESVAYSVSRLALGEACGLASHSSSDFDILHDGVRLFPDNKADKVNDQHLSKVMEDLRGRVRNLETDFLRLDKRVSLMDLRVEFQELEKFSVINRFAKFHGRGQSEISNSSSLSDGAAKAPRPNLQRYVTALPVPRSLPDRVHCFPL